MNEGCSQIIKIFLSVEQMNNYWQRTNSFWKDLHGGREDNSYVRYSYIAGIGLQHIGASKHCQM